MTRNEFRTIRNPDLDVVLDNKPRWNTPDFRRAGFHNLHRNARYALSIRSPQVLILEKRFDRRIADLPAVRALTRGSSIFSGMAIVRGQHILHEDYAPDFGPDCVHSIQSITKTTLNLIVGGLVADGLIDLSAAVKEYLPEIGTGYADATVQQVLHMDVQNDYSEDYADPFSSSYLHEAVLGWRLPPEGTADISQHEFLCGISSDDVTNRSGSALYKSANSDVLGWIAERVSGRPLRAFLIEIVEAAGLEHAFHISTDRDGVPVLDGGGGMTARDLARFGLLFVRRGRGVDGGQVGSEDFIEKTRSDPGPPMPAPRDWFHYSNQTNTTGRWLGHGGYGGQYMLADLESGVVGVFFSVQENKDASDRTYSNDVTRMLETVAGLDFE